MTIFSRPTVIAVLAIVLILTFLLGGPENRWDVAAIHWLMEARHAHPQFTSFVAVLTQLGSVYATLGLGLLASAILYWRGKRPLAWLLAGTVVGERLILDGLKLIVGRPRPDFDLHPVMTHSSSFPSGHSANSMAVFVAIALLAAPTMYRRAALAIAVCASLLVGMTRPFLGVHWPSDVIGGWTLGLLIVAGALRIGRRSGAIEAEHHVVGRHGASIGQDEAA